MQQQLLLSRPKCSLSIVPAAHVTCGGLWDRALSRKTNVSENLLELNGIIFDNLITYICINDIICTKIIKYDNCNKYVIARYFQGLYVRC